MILIGNKHAGDTGEYVGRPTPLGNPHTVEQLGRDGACNTYEEWFAKVVANPEAYPAAFSQLERLRELCRKQGHLTLLCWCAPRRCHAETIKRWLEENP